MHTNLIATFLGSSLLFGFAAAFIASIYGLERRFDPLRKLAEFRVAHVPRLPFRRIVHATIGDSPTRHAWYRYTLAFAFEAEWIYLRHSRVIPFIPRYWRLPLKSVRADRGEFWKIRIHAVSPPLTADFGPEFLRDLRGQ